MQDTFQKNLLSPLTSPFASPFRVLVMSKPPYGKYDKERLVGKDNVKNSNSHVGIN